MSVLHLYQRPYSRAAKRVFDVAVASATLFLVAPVLGCAALFVRLSGRPVIYTQRRVGEGGRIFTIYKLRTMHVDAEQEGQAEWAKERDPRVTRVGRLLRRTRFDELPQAWNVLKGDMSIVGPRPERPEFCALLDEAIPYWQHRLLLKPGITGWAQLCNGYSADDVSTEQKLSYDFWYLRHRSLLLDVIICLKTIPRLFSGWGAR
jgi:lipopolysaccharide/colanic/teichoic acid biosynthesis glycosyltransferase